MTIIPFYHLYQNDIYLVWQSKILTLIYDLYKFDKTKKAGKHIKTLSW